MKFEISRPEGPVTLPEKDRLVLLRYHLHAALAVADDLELSMAGIYIDQAICDLDEQENPAPSHNDNDPALAPGQNGSEQYQHVVIRTSLQKDHVDGDTHCSHPA